MAKKILLPIEEKPIMQAYYGQAFPFCIVESKYKETMGSLLCDKYINCIYNTINPKNIFSIYEPDSWFENINLIKHDSYVCEGKDIDNIAIAIDIVKQRLSDGWYIFCSINEGYISAINNGEIYDFDHDCFIYGFDDNNIFYSIGYINNRFVPFKIPYNEFNNGLINLTSDYIEIHFFKLNQNYSDCDKININRVKTRFIEYTGSRINELNSREDLKVYINSENIKFGIDAWDELIPYIKHTVASHRYIDIRYIKNYYEHKILMLIRLETLYESGYLSKNTLVKSAKTNFETAKDLILISMRINKWISSHEYTHTTDSIIYLSDKIYEINNTEREYLSSIIEEL